MFHLYRKCYKTNLKGIVYVGFQDFHHYCITLNIDYR